MKDFIPRYQLEKLSEIIEKLNRRAVKLSLPEITFRLTGNEELKKVLITTRHDYTIYDEKKVEIKYVEVEVKGEFPSINGYKVSSYIEMVNDIEFQEFHFLDNGENKIERDSSSFTCSHCEVKRKRKYYFTIIKEDTNEEIIVGKSCLRDFLGKKSIESVIFSLQNLFIDLAEGGQSYFSRHIPRQDYLDVVEISNSVILYIKDRFKTEASKDQWQELNGLCYIDEKSAKELSFEKRELRKDILNWIENNNDQIKETNKNILDYFSKPSKNNFENNIYLELQKETIPLKKARFGMIQWAAMIYHKIQFKHSTPEKKTQSEHFGTVGANFTRILTHVRSFSFLNAWEKTSYIHHLEDQNGNVFTWSTSKEIEENSTIDISGRVKNHTVYKDTKQTQITRCKFKKYGITA